MNEPSDEVLAERLQRGDRAALEQLVRRYLRPIHAVVRSYLADHPDVEDLAQETFLRALRAIDRYDPGRPFAPWLYQIARNLARNHLARDARWSLEPIGSGEPEASAPDPVEALERREVRERVAAAIARLPEQRRTAFRLHDVDGCSTEEIARTMGLSTGTVRSHVHHARRALRDMLGPGLGPQSKGGLDRARP